MLKNLKEKIKYLKGLPVDTFRDIYIETVATCTNNCFMCPRHDVKHYGFMSDEMFKNIIKKLKEINYSGNVHLYGQGEPFLDKKIIDKIYYIKSELPNSNIILISNFTVLNDEFIDKILKAPIKNFSCSAYALTDETYGKITGRKNNFKNSFINQVKFLKKYGEKIPFSFAYYIMDTKTFDNDFEFMIDYFFNTVPAAFLQLDLVSTLFNSKHEKLLPTRNYFSDCIYTILKISYDGLISICPCDVENKMAVGKINEENNLKEIYFSNLHFFHFG